jgi:MATE family multidrug resistance protein
LSWWNRPAGVREVLGLALPMVVSTLSWTMMTFIDSVILQRYVSGEAMSAQFSASVVWFTMLSLFWGVCTYVSTFASQYYGDGQYQKIGPITWQGVWLAVLFAPLAAAAVPLAPSFFAEHGTEVTALEIRFFQILCWGACGMLAAQALEAFFSGQGRTRVVMCVDALAVVVNLILACVLVIGLGGVQSWGADGAAWATVVAQWSRAAMYFVLLLRRRHREEFGTLSGMRFNPKLMARLIRYGGPSGVQMALDVGGFAVFVQMVGKLGTEEFQATSLVFRVSHVAFMPVWGLGMATAVLVGQKLGENRPDLARRAASTTLALALAYMGAMSLMFTLTPDIFLNQFFGHGEVVKSAAEVRPLVVQLLFFVAAYNMFDAAIIILVSVLRGAGDTQFVMLVSACMACILAAGSWATVEQLNLDLYAAWTFITGWVWALAVIYVVRYRQGRWQSMRVIEQVHHAPLVHEGEQDDPALAAAAVAID